MRQLPLIVLICLAAALAVVAYAQMGQPGRPVGPGPMPQMGPAPISMVADGGFVFVLRGPELIKIKASDMTVAGVVLLPKPEQPRPPDGQ